MHINDMHPVVIRYYTAFPPRAEKGIDRQSEFTAMAAILHCSRCLWGQSRILVFFNRQPASRASLRITPINKYYFPPAGQFCGNLRCSDCRFPPAGTSRPSRANILSCPHLFCSKKFGRLTAGSSSSRRPWAWPPYQEMRKGGQGPFGRARDKPGRHTEF